MEEIPFNKINRLLELLKSTEKMIRMHLNSGETEDSLAVRQYKHLLKKYQTELNTILKKAELPFELVEV